MTTPTVAVVGTGALGSALLMQLATHRFRSVLLIDPDDVEAANLPLSPFLSRATELSGGLAERVRVKKAEQLAAAAARVYNLHWQAFRCEIADVGWRELLTADILCCCTDSALSRAETAFIARTLAKPMLDGAVFGSGIPQGRVSMFSPAAAAACYLCGMGEGSRAAVLGYAASASLGCRPPDQAPAMTGTLATLERIAGKMVESLLQFSPGHSPEISSSAIRTFLGPCDDSTSPCWHDEPLALVRSATCPWHHEQPDRLESLPWDVPLRESVRSLLGASHRSQVAPEVQLAWPICTEAVCTACSRRSRPFLRVAAVRRHAACPFCGLIKLQPLRAVHRIRPDDALGSLTPRELGLPKRHLYWLRDTAGMNGSVQRGMA